MTTSKFTHCPYDGELLAADSRSSVPTCPRCGFAAYANPKACVAILVVRDDQVLLARRGIEPAKGQWDIPGGFVEANESAEAAVLREAREELQVAVQIKYFVSSLPDRYGSRGEPTLTLGFVVNVVSGEPRAASDVAELRWFPFDKLPQMAFEHQPEMLRRCRDAWLARSRHEAAGEPPPAS